MVTFVIIFVEVITGVDQKIAVLDITDEFDGKNVGFGTVLLESGSIVEETVLFELSIRTVVCAVVSVVTTVKIVLDDDITVVPIEVVVVEALVETLYKLERRKLNFKLSKLLSNDKVSFNIDIVSNGPNGVDTMIPNVITVTRLKNKAY